MGSICVLDCVLRLSVLCPRKWLFDSAPEDPNYRVFPDERPGGFEWGAGGGAAPAEEGANNVDDRPDE